MAKIRVPKFLAPPQHAHRVVDLPLLIGTGRTIFSNDPNDQRMRMRLQYSETEKKLLASVFFSKATVGPPGHVHGGVLCFAMDESMGTTAWAEHYPVVAGQLNVQFVAMVPVEHEYRIVVEFQEVESRKVFLHGQIQSGNKIHLDAKGIFVRLLRDQFADFAKINPQLARMPMDELHWPDANSLGKT